MSEKSDKDNNGKPAADDLTEVSCDMVELDIKENRWGEYTINGQVIGKTLPGRIAIYRQTQIKKAIPQDRIQMALAVIRENRVTEAMKTYIAATDYVPGTPNKVASLIAAIAGGEYPQIYVPQMNQMGYSFKRRQRDMTVKYPLFVNFSGNDNCGKSYFVRQMANALTHQSYIEEPSEAGSILGNMEKNSYLLTERHFVVFGEMSGMKSVSVDSLKDFIDKPQISYRGFHTQASKDGFNRAQLIGTSNKHLRDKISRDEHIRKFCNIGFDDIPLAERKANRWPVIAGFDWQEWLRSIDENSKVEPLEAVYDLHKAHVQNDLYVCTESELWINSLMCQYRGKEMGSGIIREVYEKMFKTHALTPQNLQAKLIEAGARRGRYSEGYRFSFPAIVARKESSDQYDESISRIIETSERWKPRKATLAESESFNE